MPRIEALDPEELPGGLDGRARRHQADELAADDLGAARLRLGGDRRDDLVQGGRLPVGHVHAHLDEPRLGEVETERAHAREAAIALPDERRDLARGVNVRPAQVDVECYERPAHPERALLVLEVKDWRLDTIASAIKSEVELFANAGVVRATMQVDRVRCGTGIWNGFAAQV